MNNDPNKFQNKYRIASTRLQNWNYGWDAAYFVTICTKKKDWYFGEVVDGKMKLSNIGIIANLMWYEIKNHAKNIELGEFVVMPNHVHGVLILNGNNQNGKTDHNVENVDNVDNVDDVDNIETRQALSLHSTHSADSAQLDKSVRSTQSNQIKNPPQTPGQQRFQNQGKNTLSSIVT